MIFAWNTGRLYQRNGQVIAACELGDGRIAFADVSRMIDGTFTPSRKPARPSDLQRLTMEAYDTLHGYENNLWDYPEARAELYKYAIASNPSATHALLKGRE